MSERTRRLALWCLAAAVVLPMLVKGHGASHEGTTSVTFFHDRSCNIRVGVEGAGEASGVFCLSSSVKATNVINMALPDLPHNVPLRVVSDRFLEDGDVLRIAKASGQHAEVSIDKMRVRERMILGIRLDPNTMSEADWELLPAIGPALAKRIVADRQTYGAFGSARDLERVPGIGPGTMKKIEKYFYICSTPRNSGVK